MHLYINGLYWGLYNMAERTDAGYGAAYYGGQKDDWFAISADGVAAGHRWRHLNLPTGPGAGGFTSN